MMKVADFLGGSVASRQQQKPWRWTLRAFPSGSDTGRAPRTQAPGALGAHLQNGKTKPLWVICVRQREKAREEQEQAWEQKGSL